MAGKSDLRVLSGAFKGKALQSPQVSGTHPMGAREKLALFNMVAPYLAGAQVLDAYAGTGALGVEALSRGARSVTFVEKSPQVARTLRENLQNLGRDIDSEVYVGSVNRFIQELSSPGNYDLIFADPPYDRFNPEEIAGLTKLLRKNGVLALSFPFRAGAPELSGLELQTARKYAAAGIAIYRKLVCI